MFRIAICDDNELQLSCNAELVEQLLQDSQKSADIRTFSSGEALIREVRENAPFDLYILDMVMPGMNGMETATTLRLMKDEGAIVFLSASMEYAVQSYDVDAEYYLLKPVDPHRLQKVLERVAGRKQTRRDVIEIIGPHGTAVIPVNSILYVQPENRRPKYQLTDGRFFLGNTVRAKFLDEMQSLLQLPNFAECGISTVVNLSQIDVIDGETVLIHNGDILYITKSASAALTKRWLDYRKKY